MSALSSFQPALTKPFKVAVSLGQSPAGSPSPLRFQVWGHSLEVLEVLDSWPGVSHAYFKVQASDKAFYILRQDTADGGWTLMLYSKRKV